MLMPSKYTLLLWDALMAAISTVKCFATLAITLFQKELFASCFYIFLIPLINLSIKLPL